MKVVFLDIDGVLNTVTGEYYHMAKGTHSDQNFPEHRFRNPDGSMMHREFDQFISKNWCPVAVSNLEWLLKAVPDLKIVVSSSWRGGWTKETIPEMFVHYPAIKERVFDRTPQMSGIRGNEIAHWLRLNSSTPEDYLILDDDSDFTEEQKMKQILTNPYTGFTYNDLLRSLKILGYENDTLSKAFFAEYDKTKDRSELSLRTLALQEISNGD